MQRNNSFPKILLALSLFALSACSEYMINNVNVKDNYTKPLGSSMVTTNSTVYTGALECFGNKMINQNVRPDIVTVGRILDYTGKDDEYRRNGI